MFDNCFQLSKVFVYLNMKRFKHLNVTEVKGTSSCSSTFYLEKAPHRLSVYVTLELLASAGYVGYACSELEQNQVLERPSRLISLLEAHKNLKLQYIRVLALKKRLPASEKKLFKEAVQNHILSMGFQKSEFAEMWAVWKKKVGI